MFNHWVTILLTTAAVGGAIVTIFGWVRAPIRWWRSRPKRKAQPKSAPITFVPDDLQCRWSGTMVHGRWHVTNTSESDVVILKARLSKYESQFVHVMTRHPNDERNIFGSKYPVLSHQMSEVAVASLSSPIEGPPKPIISDVIFTDNFGNEHRVRTQFPYVGPKPSPSASLWSRLMRR